MLSDRSDPYFNGLEFQSFTRERAVLAAWNHAARIVNREADHSIDYSDI